MRHGFLRPTLIMTSLLNFALNGFLIMLVVALRQQGVTAAAIGAVQAGSALGLIVGASAAAFVLRRVRAGRCLQAGTVLVAVGMFACAGSVSTWPAATLGVFVTFACLPALNAALFTYAMSAAPDGMQARVRSGIMTLAPLGPLSGGVMNRSFGAAWTLAIFAAFAMVCAAIATGFSSIRTAPLLSEIS